jgi:hypothetical protein
MAPCEIMITVAFIRTTKTQRRDTLALYVSRLLQLLEALLPKATVVG